MNDGLTSLLRRLLEASVAAAAAAAVNHLLSRSRNASVKRSSGGS